MDTDVVMVPAGEGSSIGGPSSKKPKRFEIKKWNAVALWAWGTLPLPLFFQLILPFFRFNRSVFADIVVDNCAICRNHIMDLCKECLFIFFWKDF